MIFQQLFDPKSSTFTYIIAKDVGREALIIDPVFDQVDTYISHFKRLNLRLVKALDTHIHADHVTGLGALRDITKCVTVMGEKSGAEVVSMRVREDEKINIDGIHLTTMYTPGHTDDSYSFNMNDRVFTGDALLIGGTGRTDFQSGDPLAGYDSLFNKILNLPEETLVFPAHDYRGNTVSTIGFELDNNPRLQVRNAEEYAVIMNNLNLPNPKQMDVAVPANQALGKSLDSFLRPGEALSAKDVEPECSQSNIVMIDLREKSERERDGWIPGSLHMPYGELEEHANKGGILERIIEDHLGCVILYCAYGERSALALDTVRELAGEKGLRHLAGGIAAWSRNGGEVQFE